MNDIKVDYSSNLNSMDQAQDFFQDYAESLEEQEEKFLLKILQKFIRIKNNYNNRAANFARGDLAYEIDYIKFVYQEKVSARLYKEIHDATKSNATASIFGAAISFLALIISLAALFKK